MLVAWCIAALALNCTVLIVCWLFQRISVEVTSKFRRSHLPWWLLTYHFHSNRHAYFLPKLSFLWQGNRYGAGIYFRSVTVVYGFLEPSVSRHSRYFKPRLISLPLTKSRIFPPIFRTSRLFRPSKSLRIVWMKLWIVWVDKRWLWLVDGI